MTNIAIRTFEMAPVQRIFERLNIDVVIDKAPIERIFERPWIDTVFDDVIKVS